MKPFRATAALCARSTPPTLLFRSRGVDVRGIAGTAIQSSTTVGSDPKPQYSTSFIPSDFQTNLSPPTTHQPPLSDSPFNHLLDSITRSLTHAQTANVPLLTALLRGYLSDSREWSKYAIANPSKQYTRNLVRQVPGLFNLLLLVWTPGQKSPVHDHADAHCLMKVLKGELVERRFAFPRFPGMEGRLTETGKAQYREGKVTYMADRLGLHSIANPSSSDYAVSLHLYTPPNAAIRGCRVYDTENGEARHVTQGQYDSIEGVVQK